MDVDLLDCQRGHFGKEDSPEGVGDTRIDAGEGECGFKRLVSLEFDSESLYMLSQSLILYAVYAHLLELLQRPSCIFTWVVAWKIGRGYICYCFCVDADSLYWLEGKHLESNKATYLPPVELIVCGS